jgi:hypothetical protein
MWALDRRSNCLEDNTGVAAGLAARDAHVAVDYYYRKKKVGGLIDDHSQPLAFIQSSVGFFDGGKIGEKNFPLPNDLTQIPGLEGLVRMLGGTETKAIPAEPNGPLYTWRNYDRVGDADDPGHRDDDGKPFTSAGKEVTDIEELARSMSAHPLDFTEDYFPTHIATDVQLSGSEGLFPDAVHRDGLKANPTITLQAGDGLGGTDVPGTVVVPGYQHLDVLTAAPVQNNGKPEPVSYNLARFAIGRTT